MLVPGSVVGGRWRVSGPVEGASAEWTAVDDGGVRARLVQVGPAQVATVAAWKGLEHSHLARVEDVVEQPGGAVAVEVYAEGETLAARLSTVGLESPVDAVRTTLRLADGLSVLHRAGGVHGAVHAGAVLAPSPELPHGGPLLRVAPIDPFRPGALHSPQRGPEGPPSVADDTWALTALLYQLLLGKLPPASGLRSTNELVEAGVNDEALAEALLHGLHADHAARTQDLTPLKRELARWFVTHASEDTPAHRVSAPPPPLPPSTRPPSTPPPSTAPPVPSPSTRPPAGLTLPPPRSRSQLLVVGGVAVAVGLLAAWGVSAFRKPPPVMAAASTSPAPSPPAPSAAAIDVSEVAMSGTSTEAGPGADERTSCVAAHLPAGAFSKPVDLSFLCSEKDPREGAPKLRTAVVAGAHAGTVTEAMKLLSRLGWYEMAVFAVVRAGCCVDFEPVALPPPAGACGALDAPLNQMAADLQSGRPSDEAIAAFDKAVQCEAAAGRASFFRRPGRPDPGEQSAFRDFAARLKAGGP